MNNGRLDKLVQANDRQNELRKQFGVSFCHFDQIEANPKKDWLVQNFLGAGELSCGFGPPGGAKSAIAGDLAAYVAWGHDWFNRGVEHGSVLYVAAERAGLVKRRFAAFRLHHKIETLPLAVVSGSIDLCSSRTGAESIIGCGKRLADDSGLPLRLIVIDTVSRVLAGGDENSSKDIGALINNLAHIQAESKAHVLTLHHIPHEQNRMRGHGALLAACDTTIKIEKSGDIRTATIEKNNDGEEGERIAFTLESFELSRDENAIATTAPIVQPVDVSNIPARAVTRKLSDKQQRALTALADTALDHGKPAPLSLGLPPSVSVVVALDTWRSELLARGVIPQDDKNPRATFSRIRDGLQVRQRIGEREGFVWLAATA